MHPCEDDIVCKCTTEENKVPYFNAPVYLENKEQIGKVDEIFGQLRDFVSFSLSENMKASSFKKLQKTRISCCHCRGFYLDLQARRDPQEVVAGEVEEEEEVAVEEEVASEVGE
ncbi:H/ACA ribonucleoprotein complex subunit 1, partial [Galemys pyrenaicus]